MNKLLKKQETVLSLDKDYKAFLADMKNRLKNAQIRAALANNREMILFYWQTGNELVEKQKII